VGEQAEQGVDRQGVAPLEEEHHQHDDHCNQYQEDNRAATATTLFLLFAIILTEFNRLIRSSPPRRQIRSVISRIIVSCATGLARQAGSVSH